MIGGKVPARLPSTTSNALTQTPNDLAESSWLVACRKTKATMYLRCTALSGIGKEPHWTTDISLPSLRSDVCRIRTADAETPLVLHKTVRRRIERWNSGANASARHILPVECYPSIASTNIDSMTVTVKGKTPLIVPPAIQRLAGPPKRP